MIPRIFIPAPKSDALMNTVIDKVNKFGGLAYGATLSGREFADKIRNAEKKMMSQRQNPKQRNRVNRFIEEHLVSITHSVEGTTRYVFDTAGDR